MSNTAILWMLLFAVFMLLSFMRPAYGVSLYLLTYFALPDFWWWGKGSLSGYRWTFVGGILLLVAVLVRRPETPQAFCPERRRTVRIALLMALNFTFVQMLFGNNERTFNDYLLDIKFVALFLCIVGSVRSSKDLSILVYSLVIGIGYLGYEVTVNKRGRITHGRLEGIGIPGAAAANDLGSLIITLLPIAAGLALCGRGWRRGLAAAAGGLAFNIVLLCNSRGGFLALIGSGITLLLLATGKERKQALKAIGLAGIACMVFLGDPRIIDRFMTTFVGDEERDKSAASRIDFWKAGFLMIKDHPFGSGAEAFKKSIGPKYLRAVGVEEDRAVHNGYINDACQWGIQGLLLRLMLYGSAFLGLYRLKITEFLDWVRNERFLAICIMCGMVGVLITSVFGNFIDREWTWLIIAVATAYAQVARNHAASLGPGNYALPALEVSAPGTSDFASLPPMIPITPIGAAGERV